VSSVPGPTWYLLPPPPPLVRPCVVQKRRLQHLTSRDGKAEFHSWVTSAERSILEVFQEFPSIKVPFEHLVQLLPRLSPRAYTICSSSVVTPNTVHLAVSVVQTVRGGEGLA
jgi:methionine synthase reductase